MAGGMKGIKQRIKSVRSTMQITKAMELVASSKLRRAKERAERSRPYFEGMAALMNSIGAKGNDSVYLRQRPVKHSLFIVMAGDRGLAGGYNSGAFKLARQAMEGKGAAPVPKPLCHNSVAVHTVEQAERICAAAQRRDLFQLHRPVLPLSAPLMARTARSTSAAVALSICTMLVPSE